MSIEYNAYIGPYLRVTETVQEKKIDRCVEHNRGDATYCPTCGRSKKNRIDTYEDNGAPDNWEENYKDGGFYDYLTLTSMSDQETVNGKKTYIYLPNRYYDKLGLPSIAGENYYEGEVVFDELDVPKITKKFNELFKDEMKYLKQWFEVEVKFGYVRWCS